ncbi:MAG: four helix bundle protein [Phycisphaeraceae bacterium]|nr:four helix bundle protein [Phycisphaeraceae bacterium]
MGRLRPETVERADDFSHRMADVAEELDRKRRSRRVVEQMFGAGTSVGANIYEADEAMSRADFAKTLGIVIKELNECRYWLNLAARREWIRPDRLQLLRAEADELKRMFGAMLSRTRRKRSASCGHAAPVNM